MLKKMSNFVQKFVHLDVSGLTRSFARNNSINVAANFHKYFLKCLCPLSKPFTKYCTILPCNDSRNLYATFLIMLRKKEGVKKFRKIHLNFALRNLVFIYISYTAV